MNGREEHRRLAAERKCRVRRENKSVHTHAEKYIGIRRLQLFLGYFFLEQKGVRLYTS
jgi:hypothetical protein